MENIFMRFCRETNGLSPDIIATRLDITVDEYLGIETGQVLLSEPQADQLALLFNVKSQALYESSQQLDLLLSAQAIIQAQKEKIAELTGQLQWLRFEGDNHEPTAGTVKH